MTVSVANSVARDIRGAQGAQPAIAGHSQEWHRLYQRHLAQQGLDDTPLESLPKANARAPASQPQVPAARQPVEDARRSAMGGADDHLDVKVFGRSGPAPMAERSTHQIEKTYGGSSTSHVGEGQAIVALTSHRTTPPSRPQPELRQPRIPDPSTASGRALMPAVHVQSSGPPHSRPSIETVSRGAITLQRSNAAPAASAPSEAARNTKVNLLVAPTATPTGTGREAVEPHASAAPTKRPVNVKQEPVEPRAITVTAAGHHHKEVKIVPGNPASLSDRSADPGTTTDLGASRVPPARMAIATLGLPPVSTVRVETRPTRPSVADEVHSGATSLPLGSPLWPDSAVAALARVLATPGALALPAVLAAQAEGSPDPQKTAPRASGPTQMEAPAAGAVTGQRLGATHGSGAGTTQQDTGRGADQRDAGQTLATEGDSRRHYGTFPLIVSGELLELEFVALRSGATQPSDTAVRQIFVSVQPPGMGRLEFTAQNLRDRVTVRLGGEAGNGAPPPALDVPALLARLGWGAYPVSVAMGGPR